MSVWNDPHYRSEPLIAVTQHISSANRSHPNVLSLCNFEIDDYGDFPCNAPVGDFRASVSKNPALVSKIAYKFGATRDRCFESRYLSLPEPICGISAVYKLFSHFWDQSIRFKQEFNQDEAFTFSRKLLQAMGPANYASPVQWEAWSKQAYSHWSEEAKENPFYWYQAAEAIRHLKVAKGIRSYRRHLRKAKRTNQPLPYYDKTIIFGDKHSKWEAYQHRNITILCFRGKQAKADKCYVLLTKDLTRLSQLLESTGRVFEYFSMYADRTDQLSKQLVSSAHQIYDLMVQSFKRCSPAQLNSICRSLDIGQFIYLAQQAGPLAGRSLQQQLRKGFDGYYNEVFDLQQFLVIISKWKIREALELCSIRKVLPVPDFCIYSAMNKNKQMHYNPHSMVPTGMNDVTIEDFSKYWSWSMIRNYYDRHGRCPGNIKEDAVFKDWHQTYPDMEPIHVPYYQVQDIDFEGTFIYKDYSFSEHELRKDKTMAPNYMSDKMTPAEYKALPIYEQNQIARLLLDPGIPSLTTLRESVLAGTEKFDYISLTAIKPEAKKEDGRLFYMANDAQRIMMSEKEANVAEYLVRKAGNSAGISDIELSRRMCDIASLSLEPNRKVFVSFDLDKWSPKMNPKLKRMSYDKWAYAFGLPHINKLSRVTDGARLAFLKHDIHHEYINPGQDLEGYDAKTNTAMHIEVMSYAISVCRKKGKLKKGAKLLALIDDGGMSLEFTRDTTDAEIWECIELIESVYQMVGLRISWDKTFVSELLFQYLNEIYYKGFKVTPGLKAFLRLGKLNDVPARTIVDDLDAIAGEAQGAIKAGASYRATYAAYILETFKTMKRWSGYKGTFTDQQVLCALFPVALGGVAVRSLPQICTNESINPISAAMGNLKAFCQWYSSNAPLVNQLLNTKMRQQSPEAFLRAPQSIRTLGQALNTQRFAIKMKEWIIANARNPYITNVLAAVTSDASLVIALRVLEKKRISGIGLKTLSEMQPDEAVNKLVTKLQRSATASILLGHRNCIRITMANKYQAQQVINNFGGGLKLERLVYQH